MRILRSADHRRMPWKNGGGETVEIAVHPAEAGLADFDWRVSMAHVAADGPFSRFEGIDRTLSILEGAGLRLQVEGLDETTLTSESAPFAFAADAPTEAVLLHGPITDLNVMTRRGTYRQAVERFVADAHGGLSLPLRPAVWSLLLTLGPCTIEGRGMPMRLAALDVLMAQGAFPVLRVEATAAPLTLYRISIAA